MMFFYQDIIGEDQDVVTRSFCGTEQYMSPEMLLQRVSLSHCHCFEVYPTVPDLFVICETDLNSLIL